MTYWYEIKTQISTEIFNKRFLLYIIAFFVFFISFKMKLSITLNILSLVLLLVAQGFYISSLKYDNKFQKYSNWANFIFFMIPLAIAYVASTVNEFNIVAVALLLPFIALTFGIMATYLHLLWNSKAIHWVIVSYLLLATSIILFFGILFTIFSGSPGDELRWGYEGGNVSGILMFNYFSALVFYTNTFGDILPFGVSKILVIIELMSSFILHSIILARVVDSDYIMKRDRLGMAKN